MTDFSFDFQLWQTWKDILFWSVTIVGFVSSITAYYANLLGKQNTLFVSCFVLISLVVLLGYFPIEWGYGTDRENYAYEFLQVKNNPNDYIRTNDVGFFILGSILGRFLTVQQYFVATTLIYLLNYLIAIKKLVRGNSYWLLIAAVLSMGFTSYVLNTMRAGLAISFIVLSFAMYPSKWKMAICFLVATSIHASTIIPVVCLMLSYFFPKTRLYYRLWLLSIPLSFVAGGFFMTFFSGLSGDVRTSYMINSIDTSYNVGFRIDFILYSLAPMAIGAYYMFKRGFNDRFYALIYNGYLLANIFWILVIRANYSDRFAYLSWFMIPFILMYPLLKSQVVPRQCLWMSYILFGESLFRLLI